MTRGEYANRLSMRRNWPIKVHNRRTLQTQMQCEGGSAHFNPFNTTKKMPHSWDYNFISPGVAVQNYATAAEGFEAIMLTLDEGHAYDLVDAALRRNEPARFTIALIGHSPWGTSNQLMKEVLAWISAVPGVLWLLERKPVAG